jgi:DNA replication protein
MDKAYRNPYESGLSQALAAGSASIPGMLLRYYKRIRLTELDVMLLIQLQYFREHESKDFPTWEDLQSRMTATSEQIVESLQRMLKEGILLIDEDIDSISGVQFERYNWTPLYAKLASVIEQDSLSDVVPNQGYSPTVKPSSSSSAGTGMSMEAGIFSAFEHEFGRPLSPMECETISSWLDQDHHPDELIRLALKEAVFAGKVHFKYIDRILLEWSRNRVATVQQAKEYAQRFRGSR